ncbi:MAG: alanine--tRNA ligase-related protein [Anaerolineae bacterium]
MHPHLISEQFVCYYHNLGFMRLVGTSLLHPSIPMTFVMSAGLAQVETALDELGGRPAATNFVLVQNCFRHFDIDRIGSSKLHLSLFEMPGAFSFGHNQRCLTIQRMWDFLTKRLSFDPGRLWATYFSGGKIAGHLFEEDADTQQAWQKVGLPAERIVGLGVEHNFWKQGGGIDDQGTKRKCGPNTELFFDWGFHLSCGPDCHPGCKCGRFVEFANSLFICAEIDTQTERLSLMTEPFTETVIGAERVAMLLAGQPTVFEIETLRPLVEKLRTFYPTPENLTFFDTTENEHILIDHVRALVFLIADGAPPPGKGGRRRLMRMLIRRVLAQMRILPITSPHCLPALIDLIISLHGNSGPNLNSGRDTLLAYIKAELPSFDGTLSRGSRQLDQLLAKHNGYPVEPGELVKIVKQFGIPISLLKVTLARKGVEFKEQEYLQAVEQWRYHLLSPGAANR